jgi:hypothetical protein
MAIVVGTGFLVLPVQAQLGGWGAIVAILVVALDGALLARTGAIAFLPTARLDERLAGARNRAYRLGYRTVGVAVLAIVLLHFLLREPSFLSQRDAVWDGLSPQVVFVVLEVLLVTPSMILAWGGHDLDGGQRLRSSAMSVPGSSMIAAVAALGWIALVSVAPQRAATLVVSPETDVSVAGASCAHVLSIRDVAFGLGGVVRMRSEVCWNGHVAFVFGAGRNIPLPPGALTGDTNPLLPDLMTCGPDLDQQDVIRIAEVRCSATVDRSGTLHYRASGHVFPTPLGVGGRDVEINIEVTPDGRVRTVS